MIPVDPHPAIEEKESNNITINGFLCIRFYGVQYELQVWSTRTFSF